MVSFLVLHKPCVCIISFWVASLGDVLAFVQPFKDDDEGDIEGEEDSQSIIMEEEVVERRVWTKEQAEGPQPIIIIVSFSVAFSDGMTL